MKWEVGIIEWMQSVQGSLGKTLGSIFAFIGGEMGLLVLLLIVMFCWKKEAGQKLVLVIAAVNAWLSMIKAVVLRPRPYVEYPSRVEALAPANPDAAATDVVAQGYSFPSMHSGSVVASFFTLAREAKKKWFWILAIALMICVGVSRMATGNHYPTDVLAGWVLGFVVVGIFELLNRYVQKEWVQYLVLLAITLPGVFFVHTTDYYTSLGLMIGAVVAIPFEHKFVNYQDTRNVVAMILRVVGAFAIYLVLNSLLKMPFGAEFLDSATLASFMVRTARYAIIIFVIIGIYPKVFPLFEKLGGARTQKAA